MMPPALRGRSIRTVKVGPGELYITDDPAVCIATVLGSCVAACVRDPQAGIGGLNHFMLPESASGHWGGDRGSLRFGNFAMARLIEDIVSRGGDHARLEVKLFGAAWMGSEPNSVGERNARFVLAYLGDMRLHPAAEHLGGASARRVLYLPVSGRAFMQTLDPAEAAISNIPPSSYS